MMAPNLPAEWSGTTEFVKHYFIPHRKESFFWLQLIFFCQLCEKDNADLAVMALVSHKQQLLFQLWLPE